MPLVVTHDHLADLAAGLAKLASDLAYLRDHGAPTEAMLAESPILSPWAPIRSSATALAGSVHGHPLLGSRSLITTSELLVMDPLHGWARTYSRFYRLGITAGDMKDGANA